MTFSLFVDLTDKMGNVKNEYFHKANRADKPLEIRVYGTFLKLLISVRPLIIYRAS